jgi:inorganic triphosphatase YgiF
MARDGQTESQVRSASAAPPKDIPPELYQELVRLRSCLEEQGAVIPRRNRPGDVCQLRVRVADERLGCVQRAVVIRGFAAAEAVRELIASWRAEKEVEKAEKIAREKQAAFEATKYERTVADLRRAYLAGASGGRRQRLAREFDRSAESPEGLYCLALSGFPELSRRKPGPKSRSGLC